MIHPRRRVVTRTLLFAAITLAWVDPLITWASYHYVHGSSTQLAVVVVGCSLVVIFTIAYFVERDLSA